MAGQTVPQDTKTPPSLPSASSMPLLNEELQGLYQVCNDDMRRVFLKIYRYLWGVVNGRSFKSLGVMSHYWTFARLSHASGLGPSSFTVLSYLYMLTNKGKKYIHSDILCNSGVLPDALPQTVLRVTWDLKHAGYIIRSRKDPGQPYSQKAQHNINPVYIALTIEGVKLVQKIERDYYNMLMNTSYDELTGNKKPGL